MREKTVTAQSATFIGKRRMHLRENHSGLNKFWGEEDENFQLFVPELERIVTCAFSRHQEGMSLRC